MIGVRFGGEKSTVKEQGKWSHHTTHNSWPNLDTVVKVFHLDIFQFSLFSLVL